MAAGLADHFRIDVALVRILIVVATVVTQGLGVLAYLAGWVLIPAADDAEEEAAVRTADRAAVAAGAEGRDPIFWIGVGLLVLGALWLFPGPIPTRIMSADLLWPLVLIGFGLALWHVGDRRQQAASVTGAPPAARPGPVGPPHPPGPTSSPPSSVAPSAPSTAEHPRPASTTPETTMPIATPETHAAGHQQPTDHTTPPPPSGPQQPVDDAGWRPPPLPRRSGPSLTLITLGMALVTVGALWSIDVAGVLDIGIARMVAAALLVVAVGLLVGSVAGRGRWLILVGALLLPVVVLAELLRPIGFLDLPRDVRGTVGEIAETPTDLDEVRATYELGAGSLRLDLRELVVDEPTRIEVRVGAGQVIVHLPEDVTADITARTGAGEVALPDGRRAGGIGVPTQRRSVERGEGSELLEIDVSVGLGEVRVLDHPVDTFGLSWDAEPPPDPPGSVILHLDRPIR